MSIATSREILDFWFKDTPSERHFSVDPALDAIIRDRFEETWRAARDGRRESWERELEGTLALIILLDQFSRNMFRGRAEAFLTDTKARAVARKALARGFDLKAPSSMRVFLYLPFTHSEDMADQDLCLRLTKERLGEGHVSFPYARRHRDVIARFGRFPARNAVLGRVSTPEEIAFLKANPIGF